MLPLLNLASLLFFLFLFSFASSNNDKVIFILSGGGNMLGRGGVSANGKWDGRVPPESHPSPSILRLTANLTWVEAAEPLHADFDAHSGVGPGLPFANAVQDDGMGTGDEVLGLVPSATGGWITMREWARGMRLYENMVRRAKVAVEGGGEQGTGRIEALLWYQGESDAASKEDAEAYKGRMERLVEDLRLDLGDPQLLIIQVAIISGGKFVEIVRQAQLGINLPNVLCVDAKGLPLQNDGLHLTTEAQVQLGKMLAKAYLFI